jgi:hypothetical protein
VEVDFGLGDGVAAPLEPESLAAEDL